jgi:hypothetical protein
MATYHFKILGGDFKEGKGSLKEGWSSTKLYLPAWFGWWTKDAKDVEAVEVVTDQMLKEGPSKAEAAAAGWLLLGPLGLALGAMGGGKEKREVTFALRFTDGKAFLGSSDSATFLKLKALAVARKRPPVVHPLPAAAPAHPAAAPAPAPQASPERVKITLRVSGRRFLYGAVAGLVLCITSIILIKFVTCWGWFLLLTTPLPLVFAGGRVFSCNFCGQPQAVFIGIRTHKCTKCGLVHVIDWESPPADAEVLAERPVRELPPAASPPVPVAFASIAPPTPRIAFPCPKCRATLKAPEEKAGASTKCRYCGSPVQVPPFPVAIPVTDVLPAAAAPAPAAILITDVPAIMVPAPPAAIPVAVAVPVEAPTLGRHPVKHPGFPHWVLVGLVPASVLLLLCTVVIVVIASRHRAHVPDKRLEKPPEILPYKVLKETQHAGKTEMAVLVDEKASKADVLKLAEWLRQNEGHIDTLHVYDSEDLWTHRDDPHYSVENWKRHWLVGIDESTGGKVEWLAVDRDH